VSAYREDAAPLSSSAGLEQDWYVDPVSRIRPAQGDCCRLRPEPGGAIDRPDDCEC